MPTVLANPRCRALVQPSFEAMFEALGFAAWLDKSRDAHAVHLLLQDVDLDELAVVRVPGHLAEVKDPVQPWGILTHQSPGWR